MSARLSAGVVLGDDSAGWGRQPSLPSAAERGGLDIKGVDEFGCRDEFAAVVEIGAEMLDDRRQWLGRSGAGGFRQQSGLPP